MLRNIEFINISGPFGQNTDNDHSRVTGIMDASMVESSLRGKTMFCFSCRSWLQITDVFSIRHALMVLSIFEEQTTNAIHIC